MVSLALFSDFPINPYESHRLFSDFFSGALRSGPHAQILVEKCSFLY